MKYPVQQKKNFTMFLQLSCKGILGSYMNVINITEKTMNEFDLKQND